MIASQRTAYDEAPGSGPAPPDVSELVSRYGPRLYRLALRVCPNRSDAEDLVQETFLQAVRKFGGFQGRSDPGTWLFRVAVRLCRRKFGHGKRQRVPPVADLLPFLDRGVVEVPANRPSPLALQIARETLAAVEARIASLPAMFRLPLILKEIIELSVADVASILGIKPQTVKTRVHRARLLIRQTIMRTMPQRPAPAPTYDRRVCLDLLAAKMDAMDQGRGFPIGHDVLCDRCRAVFLELDLTQEACARLGRGEFPASLKRAILESRDGGSKPPPPRSGNLAPPRSLKAAGVAESNAGGAAS